MKTFKQFQESAGLRSAVTSSTTGGDSGFQARQQAGLNRRLDKLLKGGGKKGVGSRNKQDSKGKEKGETTVEKKPESEAPLTIKKGTRKPERYRIKGDVKKEPVAKKVPTKAEVKDVSDKKPTAQKALPSAKPIAKKPMVKVATGNDKPKALPPATKRLPAAEAYDPEIAGRSQIRKQGEGGRIGAERKKSEPERRRMKAVGGGKTAPVGYKPRKDIGQQRQRSTREQQPTQERGSAAAAQAAAAKEERKRAAQARIAARKAGGGDSKPAAKTSSRDTEKAATKLLSTKKPEKKVSPDYKPQKASGMTRGERMSQQRKGEAALKDIMKKQEFSRYERETGQKATGKAKTKLLGRVAKRMAN
jgi:hypothetical protein